MESNDEILTKTYNDITALCLQLIRDGVDPLIVAAALVSLGASIYKTTLSEEDFNLMMDSVSDLRDQIQRLGVNAQPVTTLQ